MYEQPATQPPRSMHAIDKLWRQDLAQLVSDYGYSGLEAVKLACDKSTATADRYSPFLCFDFEVSVQEEEEEKEEKEGCDQCEELMESQDEPYQQDRHWLWIDGWDAAGNYQTACYADWHPIPQWKSVLSKLQRVTDRVRLHKSKRELNHNRRIPVLR